MSRRRKRSSISKDKFIDLAQAALEEADLEDDKKGVLEQVVEALISTTGAPMLSEVIAAQLASQDVIERIAEQHFIQKMEQSRAGTPDSTASTSTNNNNNNSEEEPMDPIDFKEHDDPATLFPPSPPPEPMDGTTAAAAAAAAAATFLPSIGDASIKYPSSYSIYSISDYLWRLFRILILASLVALLYQFYLHHQYYFVFLT
ncbi:unnamed protein product [Absidia cylindrospora]